MQKRSCALSALALTALLSSATALAQEQYVIVVTDPYKHDISDRLDKLVPKWQAFAAKHEIPLKTIPAPVGDPAAPDPGLQDSTGGPAAAAADRNWEGLGKGFPGYTVYYAPPDTTMAVGPNHVVQWVNVDYVVFDKSGNTLGGPYAGNQLWQGFGGACETTNDGDPIVLYDKLADRWVLTQFAISGGYHQCVAVSTTPDPLGSYARYDYLVSSTDLNDYPKFSVWPDGYYATYNMFRRGILFSGARACAYERDQMLMGQAARSVCFQLSTSYSGLLPSDLDGSTPPPAGSPNYFLNIGSNALRLWKFAVNWANPSASTFSGPATIPVNAFAQPCVASRQCVAQPGTSSANYLDDIGDRLMYRLAYRNFGTHESLAANHTVAANGDKTGVRWYELRNPNGTPVVQQQGTFAPADGNFRWMGSIAMDKAGNIGVGYSRSGASTYPSIYVTGREAGDPAGQLQAEQSIAAGGGIQLATGNRWGDYSTIVVDPVDDCTFWFTSEYTAAPSGEFNWNTRIASFKFPSCGGAPPPVPAAPSGLSATAISSNQVNLAWTDNSNNEDGFRVQRCTGAGCTDFSTVATPGANAQAYSDTSVSGSTLYRYRVLAYNAGGESGTSNIADATPPAAPSVPAAPSGLSATAVSSNQVNLAWTDNSNNEDGFRVQR
ncbi:MAG: fibronectin type III domain-containing protein, partial [Bryobacterales bacterium]|nr:fibronectin type III domain-containing protein [Bryobacterales bacterium]